MESISSMMAWAVWIIGGIAGFLSLGVIAFFVVRRMGQMKGSA